MELTDYFKSVLEQDVAPVVICDRDHTVIYVNPAAVRRYHKHGGAALTGRSLLACHAPASREKIREVVAWFEESPAHNRVFTYHHERDNADVYMVALRDETGNLIGYYEQHVCRTPETAQPYGREED